MRRAFSLIEILVTVAVVAILVAIVMPALASAREAARSAGCLSNLRQMAVACTQYADDNAGVGPAVGQPYAELPNWALVVQSQGGRDGSTPGELYGPRSVLVCPSTQSGCAVAMTRTYAMNATGHAGLSEPGQHPDPDNFDDITDPAFIRFALVSRPSESPLLFDSASAPISGDAPPPSRTASVLDFRQPAHVAERLGLVHPPRGKRGFNAGHFDGAAHMYSAVPAGWTAPLP